MSKKKVMIPWVATACAVLALVIFSVIQMQRPVSAAELTQQSLHKIAGLSAEQQRDLNTRVKSDAKSELEAAKQAKDLTVLTYDEMAKQSPGAPPDAARTSPTGTSDNGPAHQDMRSLTYLRYTDASGATHILGLDKDGLPTLVMVYRSDSTGSQGSVMKLNTDGADGPVGGSTSGDGPQPPAGATTCSSSAGGQVTCTGEGHPNCTTLANGAVTCFQAKAGSPGPDTAQ